MPYLIGSEAKGRRGKLQEEADEIAKTVRRILYFLVLSCAYLVVIITVPDTDLVTAKSEIKVQPWGVSVKLATLMTFAPAYLIGILVYIHLFLGRLEEIRCAEKIRLPEIYLFSMTSAAPTLASCFIFYVMVPTTLAWFIWKVPFLPESQVLFLMTLATAWISALLWLHRERRQDNVRPSAVLCLVWLAVLAGITANFAWTMMSSGYAAVFKLRALDLRNANLSEEILNGRDLSGMDFTNADLSGASLKDAKLENAILDGADLSNADLTKTQLQDAELKGADLGRATLDYVDFTGAKLQNANLNRVIGQESNFTRADLTGAKLAEAKLHRAQFREAILNDIDAAGTDFSCSVFNRAKLIRANFRSTNLLEADFKGADLTSLDARFAINVDPGRRDFADTHTTFSKTRLPDPRSTEQENDPDDEEACRSRF